MLTRHLRTIAAMTAFAPVLGGLQPGDLPGLYFQADDGGGGGGGGDNNGSGGGGGNDGAPAGDANLQARFDALQAQHAATEAERKRLADAETARQQAEMSELERERQRADTAAAEAAANRQELLRMRIANELGVGHDALDLLTGTDEATLRAQAEKIVALGGKSGSQQQQVNAGTRTNPGGQQQPTVDEQIAAAVKGGNDIAAIRLMRQKQGLSK